MIFRSQEGCKNDIKRANDPTGATTNCFDLLASTENTLLIHL